MGCVHKGGGKFDFEKAKWFNHEWIRKQPVATYKAQVKELFRQHEIIIEDEARFEKVLELVKDRCTLLPDFVQQASFFFQPSAMIDTASIQPKWNEAKKRFFTDLIGHWQGDSGNSPQWEAAALEVD